jgi:hypothetical protein
MAPKQRIQHELTAQRTVAAGEGARQAPIRRRHMNVGCKMGERQGRERSKEIDELACTLQLTVGRSACLCLFVAVLLQVERSQLRVRAAGCRR